MTDTMTRPDHVILSESLNRVTGVANDLIVSFYARLFVAHPDWRAMFPGDDEAMAAQRDKLLAAIVGLVSHYETPDQLLPALAAMGKVHNARGVNIIHYAGVGEALLATLAEFSGANWTKEYEGAWLRAYQFAAGHMMLAQ